MILSNSHFRIQTSNYDAAERLENSRSLAVAVRPDRVKCMNGMCMKGCLNLNSMDSLHITIARYNK